MLPSIRYQNDVTKILHFRAPFLAKPWLRSWLDVSEYDPFGKCRRLRHEVFFEQHSFAQKNLIFTKHFSKGPRAL